jgi:hypothetical protein
VDLVGVLHPGADDAPDRDIFMTEGMDFLENWLTLD